jgi:hypothetical protein
VDDCAECGFSYAGVSSVARLGEFGPRYAAAFGALPDVRRRPAEGVWSPLEYACHVRDVFRVQRDRVGLALSSAEPVFAPMGRDERAVIDAYNDQEPGVVLAELTAAADELAGVFGRLTPAELARTGVYNWPEPRVVTVHWIGRHSVHEGEHHLMDVLRPFA